MSDCEEEGDADDEEVAAVNESAQTSTHEIIRPIPRMGEQTIPLDLSSGCKRARLE